MAKKLGFALGAGGSRGVAHVGFLQAMEENGIKPDFIAGSSMGSVVGACYAYGYTPAKMKEEVLALKFGEIFDLSFNFYKNGALLRSKKMVKKLRQFLKHTKVKDLQIPFCTVATDLISGQSVKLDGDIEVVTAVAASSTMPGVFKPVELKGKMLVDGGVKCRVPVEQVREMGAEVIVAVDVLGSVREKQSKYNIFSVFTRMIDISDAELTKYKMKDLKPDVFIEPDMGDMVQYKFKDMEKAYDAGYEIGLKYADEILRLIKE